MKGSRPTACVSRAERSEGTQAPQRSKARSASAARGCSAAWPPSIQTDLEYRIVRSYDSMAPAPMMGAFNSAPPSFVVILCAPVRRVSVSGRTQSMVSSSLRKYGKFPAKVANFLAPAVESVHPPAHRGNALRYSPPATSLASESLLVLPVPKSRNQV